MALFTSVRCDVCGAEKREANHWFALRSGSASIVIAPMNDATSDDSFLHLCGEKCLIGAVSLRISDLHRKAVAA